MDFTPVGPRDFPNHLLTDIYLGLPEHRQAKTQDEYQRSDFHGWCTECLQQGAILLAVEGCYFISRVLFVAFLRFSLIGRQLHHYPSRAMVAARLRIGPSSHASGELRGRSSSTLLPSRGYTIHA